MTYADWVFYEAGFLGVVVPQEAFERVAARASRWLDMLTFGRIDAVYGACDAVRMACCAVCEVLYAAEEDGGRVVSRERLDTAEVAYAQTETVSMKRRVLEAARVYLWPTGLLSMAVKRGGLADA